jgi:hypothetical protein
MFRSGVIETYGMARDKPEVSVVISSIQSSINRISVITQVIEDKYIIPSCTRQSCPTHPLTIAQSWRLHITDQSMGVKKAARRCWSRMCLNFIGAGRWGVENKASPTYWSHLHG